MRLALSLLLILTGAPLQAATFVVDTTSDDGALSACTAAAADCSLRGAIFRANAIPDFDEIAFDIPTTEPGCVSASGVCRIEASMSFSITRGLTIDGYSQPGAMPNSIPAPGANNAQLKIEITSAGLVNLGVALFSLANGDASPFSLRGLAIALPTSAIVSGGLRHDHRGNWFCVDASGQSLDFNQPCSAFGLSGFLRSIRVGGPDPADRNVIAGGGRNGDGLPLGGTSTLRVNSISGERGLILLQGNLIGLAPDGVTPLPMRDPFNISTGDDSFLTPDIRILDNRFSRAQRSAGGGFGGALRLSVNRTMDETALIQGNVFGLGVDGTVVGVEKDHVEIFLGNGSRVPRVLVGGLGTGEGNTFAGALRQSFTGLSLGSAVILPSGNVTTFVEFAGNRMLGNAGIGLDFPTSTAGGGVAVGRTPNDIDDADIGANLQQNFPTTSAFSINGDQFDITYRVESAPANSSYPLRVDFYKALGDEGELLLDSDVHVESSAQQDTSVTLMIPPGVSLEEDDVIVAIATDAQGRSSEFSFDTLSLAISDTPDPHPAGLPVMITATAVATSGPFKPNGVVDVSMATSPVTTCTITLQPTATANTSTGSCELIPVQTGSRLITATYRTLQGAFGSESGGDVVATEPHMVSAPGPEQLSLRSCLGVALEGRDLIVEVRRPSGGVGSVQVDLQHEAGTATPGVDYVAPPDQSLTWDPGDIAPRLITIPITADGTGEPVETFRLRLLNPMSAAIVPHALIEYRILDGDDRGFRDGFEGECPNN